MAECIQTPVHNLARRPATSGCTSSWPSCMPVYTARPPCHPVVASPLIRLSPRSLRPRLGLSSPLSSSLCRWMLVVSSPSFFSLQAHAPYATSSTQDPHFLPQPQLTVAHLIALLAPHWPPGMNLFAAFSASPSARWAAPTPSRDACQLPDHLLSIFGTFFQCFSATSYLPRRILCRLVLLRAIPATSPISTCTHIFLSVLLISDSQATFRGDECAHVPHRPSLPLIVLIAP